jgi:hypothetical protein
MSCFAFIVAFVATFVLGYAKKAFPQIHQGKMHFGGSIANLPVTPSAQNHLRKESVDVALESSAYIRKNGFYEAAVYNSVNAAGKCVHPEFKQIYAVNVCIASAVENPPAPYAIGTIFADSTGNTYYLYEQWFSDSTCTHAVTPNTYSDYSSFIAICDPNW